MNAQEALLHPHDAHQPETLLELLQRRARQQPDGEAYTFLLDGDHQTATVTYRELDIQARCIGAELQRLTKSGERALLLYPPGLDYIAAFFGCLYAGQVAVPVYPPQRQRSVGRVKAILNDAQPVVVLTNSQTRSKFNRLLSQDSELASLQLLRYVETDHLDPALGERWQKPCLTSGTLAFLQYTSGSTGIPKGVMLSHHNLLHNQQLIQGGFGHDKQTIVVGWLPLYHDMGLIGNVLQPLYLGVPAILMSPYHFLQQPVRWLIAISRYRATTSGGPNFAYDLCVRRTTAEQRAALDLSCWRVAFNGAEPVRPGTMKRFADTFGPCGFRRGSFYPCYGLAEATLFVAGGAAASTPIVCHVQESALEQHCVVEGPAGERGVRTLVSSGSAQLDQCVLVVDPKTFSRCSDSRVGEIWVQGPSVAGGYWNQGDKAADIFGAHLDTGEGPFLRTGDLGFLQRGQLFVTGRLKDLIIIRGRNHYPHDIELTVETCHASLRPGCGAAFSVDIDAEERLIVVQEVELRARFDTEAVAETIRSAVAEEHDVYVDSVVLIKAGSLPKTSSGKVQRHACRRQYLARTLEVIGETHRSTSTIGASVQPSWTPLEKTLADIWADVLGREQIGRGDHFFTLGGDSLRAAQVISRVHETFGLELSLDSLFERPTLGGLASLIETEMSRRSRADAESEGPARRAVKRQPIPSEHPVRLSFAQQRLWFLDQLKPGLSMNNIPVALRLSGPLNVAALQHAITEIVRRHETLRTTFMLSDGNPMQIIGGPAPVSIPVIDLRAAPLDDREAQAARRMCEAARQPFDLALERPMRIELVQMEEEHHLLLLTVHHAAADDWSMAVFSRELAMLYAAFSAGRSSPLPEVRTQYREIAWNELERLQGERLNAHLSYWKARLEGSAPLLMLPTDHSRPALPTFAGACHPVTVTKSVVEGLKALAERQDATLFMVLLAAFQVLLHRYSGQDDISIGSSVANRHSTEAEKLIGLFANMLVFRVRLAGDPTFLECLGMVRDTALGAYAHQDLPFEMLVAALKPERNTSATPLFQASFVLHNTPPPTVALSGLTVTRLDSHNGTSPFDLTLSLTEEAGQLTGSIEYSLDLFEEPTIARLASSFKIMLEGILERPDRRISEMPLLAVQERQQILKDWNATRKLYPRDRCIHELIEDQAARIPDAVAVVLNHERLTYRTLMTRANHLAQTLRQYGVGPDILVGVCLERSLNMVVALLAILKAGGAYVPIDPESPRERVAFILKDAGMAVLLTHRAVAEQLPAYGGRVLCLDSDQALIERESPKPSEGGALQTLAYMIYTSGSTGRPKGACIPHAGLLNRLQWMQEHFALTSDDRVLQKTPFSFDVSVWEFFWPLMVGARLVLARPGDHKNGERLVELITQQQITTLHFVPPMLQTFLETPGINACLSLRRVICSGEALPAELQRRFFERMDAELHNLYGPTEASIDVTVWACRRDDRRPFVPIGRPIANTQIYLLDGRLEPVPIGVLGELYIGGDGVGRGYFKRPELTAEKFVPDPFGDRPGARLYKTGDVARFLPDGTIVFLGRNDNQVKIRGYRIELGEVEAVLTRHPGVQGAVVLAVEERGDKRLVAFAVLRQDRTADVGDLRRFMREQLPDYMVPAAFVIVAALPLNSNGKVDRASLLLTKESPLQRDTVYAAPRSDVERAIAAVWQEVLEAKTVSIHDNFFDLGGQSLLLAKVWSKLRGQFRREPTMLDLFQYPTIESLARWIAEGDTPTPVGLGTGVQSERLKAGQDRLRQRLAQRHTAASREERTR